MTKPSITDHHPAARPWWREALDEKQRELVRRNVEAAPPLTDQQRTRLAELLRPARQQRERGRKRDAA